MFGLKRTLKSLMLEMEAGLRNGTIVLDAKAADPPPLAGPPAGAERSRPLRPHHSPNRRHHSMLENLARDCRGTGSRPSRCSRDRRPRGVVEGGRAVDGLSRPLELTRLEGHYAAFAETAGTRGDAMRLLAGLSAVGRGEGRASSTPLRRGTSFQRGVVTRPGSTG